MGEKKGQDESRNVQSLPRYVRRRPPSPFHTSLARVGGAAVWGAYDSVAGWCDDAVCTGSSRCYRIGVFLLVCRAGDGPVSRRSHSTSNLGLDFAFSVPTSMLIFYFKAQMMNNRPYHFPLPLDYF